MSSFDLVSSLQALPETDAIELDGVQFGPTCVVQNVCQVGVGNVLSSVNVTALNTLNVLPVLSSLCAG